MTRQTILIIGALSAIAVATARRLAGPEATFVLLARDGVELGRHAGDLRVRGATVYELTVDLVTADVDQVLDGAVAAFGPLDIALLAYGSLTDQARGTSDLRYADAELRTNFSSAAAWSLAVGRRLRTQGAGTLIVLGSVAGDRGRSSNYIYGAAKAGIAVLVQGLAHELALSGDARAMVIKPGFVDTPMTDHLVKRGLLWTSADQVAARIVRAIHQGRPVVYAPSFWRFVMAAIRLAPSPLFHRTRL